MKEGSLRTNMKVIDPDSPVPPAPPAPRGKEWPVPDAPDAVKPSVPTQSAHGTEPVNGSDGSEPTLSACLLMLIQRLDALIDQNAQLIEMMLEPPEQDTDEVPTRYLNGQRIS